ncbi:MAG: hypothetical protein KJ703_00335 [Alphaproteobacteria bacterium]|nr:hypothetical protein [Alphaproteobacteria bacterium]MBU1755438.1 hypothetical protein [Alphaproteobacteria bacterium]
MNKTLIIATALLVAACSQEPASSESADDFANRVGAPGAVVEGGVPAPVETTAVKAPPPANADVFRLEKLGIIGGVDLGPRAGGCTFSVQGQEMLIAAAPADRALPGKATVRIGGQLLLLDSPPGGIEQVRSGTSFAGEGFSARITRTGPDQASLMIADAAGTQKAFAGNWVCS